MTSALTVAAIQYEALDGGVLANVPEHVRHIEDAHSRGARLVVFPELSLTGYDLELYADEEAWVAPGDPRLERIREIARRTGVTVIVGAGFREGDGTPRLASLVIRPPGDAAPAFKTHVHGAERELFVPGEGPALLELDGWRIALAICFDAAVPSHASSAAEAGADLYAVSAVYVQGEEHRLGLHLGARSMDNRMFGVLANMGGSGAIGDSCGLSGAWGPDGRVLAQLDVSGSAIAIATLQPEALLPFR
ncbi:carbon-nitrogen hydrolase family protein [Arthrobacter sp. B2a2-09]|uniref:carbon-nitrogen hydrolase family protein n=1 Tax=Arthrobacter sp. B2a2-09 TaxID=2952822 RepID=UPI0022CDAB6A|nr:carbon-nitrogen hydrolase family protein [Arthrobacter sp. B2a2-09]MCZ9882503.1 carbon-nitrogen hydrolase family protein [Arthrobacter sp. B2a2-09]